MSANLAKTVLASSVQTATHNSGVQQNYVGTGGHIIVDVTSVPGVDTITPIIEAQEVIGGSYYTLLTGPAISTVSTTVLKVFPGATVVANSSVSDILPLNWRVRFVHSAGTNFTYSASANLVS